MSSGTNDRIGSAFAIRLTLWYALFFAVVAAVYYMIKSTRIFNAQWPNTMTSVWPI
mgnify:CR=1 FL=1